MSQWRGRMHRLALLSLVACSSGSTAPAAPAHVTRAFRDVRVFDGERVIERANVLLDGESIAAVGRDLPIPAGVPVIEGKGNTLLPGLIDAHAHANARFLHEALAFGVTTELDMGCVDLSREIAPARRAQRTDSADVRSAGWAATVPGGHGTEYGGDPPTLTTPREAEAFVDARLAEGSDYIKVIDEHGIGFGRPMPSLDDATIAAIASAAHRRGKLAVCHIGSAQEARAAIGDGCDGLAHLFADRAPDADFGAYVAAHGAFVTATLDVLRSGCGGNGAELAADPRIAPDLMPDQSDGLAGSFGGHCDLEHAFAAVRQLRDAHVPILAGTDAPNPGTAHGASLHEELALLVKAGLTPTAALAAATATPARVFHLADRGRVAAGLRADLLLVHGDPTKDITATRDIVAVFERGTPVDRAAWRAQATHERERERAGLATGRIADFEGGTTDTQFGGGLDASTDNVIGGHSTAKLEVVVGGAPGSGKSSLRVTGTVEAGPMGFGFAGVLFAPGLGMFAPRDLSAKHELTFWARGDGRTYSACLFAKNLGFRPACKTFPAGASWQQQKLELAGFGPADLTAVTAISFSAGVGGGLRDPAGSYSFQLDDLRLE